MTAPPPPNAEQDGDHVGWVLVPWWIPDPPAVTSTETYFMRGRGIQTGPVTVTQRLDARTEQRPDLTDPQEERP